MKNLTYRIALILLVLGVSSAQAFAQQVKGTVKDTAGEPIIGASVTVDGSTTGTTSNIDGSFAIDAPKGAVLVVSFIGYETQRIDTGGGGVKPSTKLSLRKIRRVSTRSWSSATARRRKVS